MVHAAPVTPTRPLAALPDPSPASLAIARLYRHPALILHPDEWPEETLYSGHSNFRWDWHDILRFLGKTEQVGSCLNWTGAKSRGKGNQQWYGSFYTKGKTVRAHKFSAVAILGLRVRPGYEIDHHCMNTLCVAHLRTLTRAQNQALIRRPTKRELDLARELGITPAEAFAFTTPAKGNWNVHCPL